MERLHVPDNRFGGDFGVGHVGGPKKTSLYCEQIYTCTVPCIVAVNEVYTPLLVSLLWTVFEFVVELFVRPIVDPPYGPEIDPTCIN